MPKTYNAAKAFRGANAKRKRVNSVKTIRKHIGKGVSLAKQAYGAYEKYAPLVESIAGMGDYHVGRGFKGTARHMQHAKMGSGGHSHKGAHISLEKGEMTITHSEYIGDLISSNLAGVFTTQAYGINPGNAGTFPWLSGTAVNFQHYKFDKLVFEYRPLVSESSSSAAGSLLSMGSSMLSTQYNSATGPYPNKATICESDYAVTRKPSEQMLHAVECDPKFNPLGVMFVSANTNLTVGQNGTDIRMQNLGIFQASCFGIPTGGVPVDLGELWVHYTCRLLKPQLNAGLTNLESCHYFSSLVPATVQPFGAVTAANQPIPAFGSLLALTFASNGTVTFPLAVTTGCFLMVYRCCGTAAAADASWQNPVNGSLLQVWSTPGAFDNANSAEGGQNTLVGQTEYVNCCIFQANAPGSALAGVQIGSNVVPTAGRSEVFVTPWNTNIQT